MPESRDLIIIGTGGNAYDIIDIVEALNAVRQAWNIIGFLDDSRPAGSEHCGLSILGTICDAPKFRGALFINAVGSDQSYRQRVKIVAATGLCAEQFATLIHPRATVSTRAALGRGSYVCGQACIGGAASVGEHVAICAGAIVGHDALIDDFSIIAPGACVSGSVHVMRSCYIGARAVIRPRVSLPEGTLVGMGAVVVRSVMEPGVLVGNPARMMNTRAAPEASIL